MSTGSAWQRHSARAAAVGLVLVVFVLSGCGVLRNDITFQQGGRWRFTERVTIPAQMVSMYGGEAGLESALQEQAGSDSQELLKSVKIERGSDGSLTYVLNGEGEGVDDLNQKAFEGSATITRSPAGQIAFSYAPVMGVQSYSLSIKGGKILSSNADEVKGNTAIWHDLVRSGTAEVVLLEPSGPEIPWGLLGGGAVLLLVALVALILVSRRRPSAAAVPSAAVQPGAVQPGAVPGAAFCMNCGAKLAADAAYCANCGQPVGGRKPS